MTFIIHATMLPAISKMASLCISGKKSFSCKVTYAKLLNFKFALKNIQKGYKSSKT